MKTLLTLIAIVLFFAPSAHAATLTVFPDPSPAVIADDGYTFYDVNNQTWATVQGAAASSIIGQSPGASTEFVYFQTATNAGLWLDLVRSHFLFDTSALTSSATISAATLSLFGSGKQDLDTITPNINIYTSSPASNTSLANSDYSLVGSTALSTAISYASWSTTAYNDFVLNSTGLTNISKTGVSKFSARNATYDAANVAPTNNGARLISELDGDYATTAGTANDPKLVITYTLPSTGTPQSFFMW